MNPMNTNSQTSLKSKSVVNKWWLMISASIFFLLAASILAMMQVQLNYHKNQEVALTNDYVARLTSMVSRANTIVTANDVVLLLNQSNSWRQGEMNLYVKEFTTHSENDYQLNIQVFNTDRQEIFHTQNWSDPVTFGADHYERFGTTSSGSLFFQSGNPVFSAETRKLIGYIQVTNRLFQYQAIRQELSRLVMWMIVISLAISLVAGFLLSRYMVRPIRKIHDIISSITESNISTIRLDVSEKNLNELDLVSLQFNDLLDKISFYIDQQKHFVEDVSHELRTPVAIVEGHLKLLNRWGKNDPKVLDESLQASLSELKRMKTLVQEMLDLSRAPQVREHYKDVYTPIYATLQQIISNFRMLYPHFTFVFDLDLVHEVQCQIYHNHFEQIVIILLDNAVKYSLDRKEIIVSLSRTEGIVEIGVQDFGMGMSEEDRRKVFSRFYRVDKARSRDLGGNGLGLSIAKELIESYQGQISLTTSLDSGSIFRIQLPISQTLEKIGGGETY